MDDQREAAKGRRKKPTREEMFARLREVETLIARRLSTSAIETHLSGKWNVTRRQVRDYIARMRAQWAAEATTEGRIERRDHLRASVNDLYSRAMARTEIVRDAAGNPIMDPQTQRPMLREVPDLKTAVRASEVLARLDGLNVEKPGGPLVLPLTTMPALDFAKGKDRTALLHFAQTGRWPDEDDKPAAGPPKP